jgi:pimeloyl-ACP methyl ester carboxylesterase/predicted glycosyltransferase
MRALEPVEQGFAERDGIRLHWERFGAGETTIALLPTWSVLPSRFWKLQVPYLARRHSVITFDGRGSGQSSRPSGAEAYTHHEFAADTLAVLDATDTEQAVLVALSCGATWGIQLAADHPNRVSGLIAVCPAVPLSAPHPERQVYSFDDPIEATQGWAKYNRHYWDADYEGFLSFFFGRMFTEPHSTKQIEDCIAWGLDIEPDVLADATQGLQASGRESFRQVCSRVAAPVLVIHGDEDAIRPFDSGAALAELTGGQMVAIAGGGHGPQGRDPVVVNRFIEEFVSKLPGTEVPSPKRWVRAARRRKRALYLSSPIGLGHARRDLAIATELRQLHPDLEIDWLTQSPVTALLEAAQEHVHPASRWLVNESAHFEDEAHEHDLHAFQAVRRMDEILVNNFMVFHDLVVDEHYDLVIGDEAWDVDYFLHENPELKRFAFAWMTDFVGWLPMPDGGAHEAALTADYNAEMLEQRARYRRLRDRSIFVGQLEDIVTDTFGPGLPSIRSWTEQNFDFAGYITGFDPADFTDREALRAELGYRPDERVCIVTVGGSGVGQALLRCTIAAIPLVHHQLADVRFVVVAGPRIDPRTLPRRKGVSYRRYVPDLHRHLAACDIAVVQGGLTTCMELTANQRPFIYVPLQHHFEQTFHVTHRLRRHNAGLCMTYEQASDPDTLAAAIVTQIDTPVCYRPVDPSGAARAAGFLADLI